MAKVLIIRTRNNGHQLQMKQVNSRLVWFYLKRGWQVNTGQII